MGRKQKRRATFGRRITRVQQTLCSSAVMSGQRCDLQSLPDRSSCSTRITNQSDLDFLRRVGANQLITRARSMFQGPCTRGQMGERSNTANNDKTDFAAGIGPVSVASSETQTSMTALCFSGFVACRVDASQIAVAQSCSGECRHGCHAQGICHTAHEVRLGAARAPVKVESVASATTSERKINLMFTRGQVETEPNVHLRRPMKMKQRVASQKCSRRDRTGSNKRGAQVRAMYISRFRLCKVNASHRASTCTSTSGDGHTRPKKRGAQRPAWRAPRLPSSGERCVFRSLSDRSPCHCRATNQPTRSNVCLIRVCKVSSPEMEQFLCSRGAVTWMIQCEKK